MKISHNVKITLALLVFIPLFIGLKYALINKPWENKSIAKPKPAPLKDRVVPLSSAGCKDGVTNFVYFKFGDELFRYDKDSIIKIIIDKEVGPISASSKKNVETGCSDKPYTREYSGVSFDIDYQKLRLSLGDVKIEKLEFFTLIDADSSKKSWDQKFIEEGFFRVKNKYGQCDEPIENLIKCVVPYSDSAVPREMWSGYYMAKESYYRAPDDQAFVYEYRVYAAAPYLRGDVYYRLYPTVDIHYLFYGNNFDPSNVIALDKVFRNIFESMRFKR